MENQKKKIAKWRDIFKELKNEIGKGVYSDDNPLPSEKRLGLRFGVSRITVVRALDELCHEGLVERVRGSGTYPTPLAQASAGHLGLIFPDLAMGEIFPLIFQELMRCAQRDGYTFVFGDIASADAQTRAHKACDVARCPSPRGRGTRPWRRAVGEGSLDADVRGAPFRLIHGARAAARDEARQDAPRRLPEVRVARLTYWRTICYTSFVFETTKTQADFVVAKTKINSNLSVAKTKEMAK